MHNVKQAILTTSEEQLSWLKHRIMSLTTLSSCWVPRHVHVYPTHTGRRTNCTSLQKDNLASLAAEAKGSVKEEGVGGERFLCVWRLAAGLVKNLFFFNKHPCKPVIEARVSGHLLAETRVLICNLLRPFRDAEKGELSVYTPASSHICHFCNGKVCMLGARFTEISECGSLLLPLSLSVCLLSVSDRDWICWRQQQHLCTFDINPKLRGGQVWDQQRVK